jgi:hypothetical protein
MAAPVVARDTHAPPGANDRWLPCEQWVMFHWLPFDERQLYAASGIKRHEFRKWIRDDDNHTLAGLIEKRGGDPRAIVAALMNPVKAHRSPEQFAELTRRANELMTQGHLSQHVFFHYFHDPLLAINSRAIFNIAPGDYQRARLTGFSPAEIAIRGGVAPREAVRRAFVVLRANANQAVRRGEVTRSQSSFFLRRQRNWLGVWLTQTVHSDRKRVFPSGRKPAKGNRLRQACSYMAGSGRPSGRYDDPATTSAGKALSVDDSREAFDALAYLVGLNGAVGEAHGVLPALKHEVTALGDRNSELGSLHCDLVSVHALAKIDPHEIAALRHDD